MMMRTALPTGQDVAVYRMSACFVCGRTSRITLPAPTVVALVGGAPVQHALPDLPRPEREQLISGTHPDWWAAVLDNPADG